MLGYKVIYTKSRNKYKVGKKYKVKGEPDFFDKGYLFFTELKHCVDEMSLSGNYYILEVDVLGDVIFTDDHKMGITNKMRVLRCVSIDEYISAVNEGRNCYGVGNCGFKNEGNYNLGCWNRGSYNTGFFNIGSSNVGNYNYGDYNTGDHNIGSHNTGKHNTGNKNTGDWNNGSNFAGCFNTIPNNRIYMFNKPSSWTIDDWRNSTAYWILSELDGYINWVDVKDMTDEDKMEYPSYKYTDGCLKTKPIDRQKWWDNLPESQQKIIMELPNFDADVFKEITLIDVNK